MRRIRILPLAIAFFIPIVLLCGCGEKSDKGVVVKGKLLKGNQPFQAQLTGPKYPEGEGVGMAEVVLYPVKADDEKIVDDNGDATPVGSQTATVSPDGSFTVGNEKQGIAPGKYRFVIRQIDPLTDKDKLGNKFDERNSRITRDVNEGQEIVIDLAKPGG